MVRHTLISTLFPYTTLFRSQILLQIGAGTGAIFLLRWFWWRINAWSEIAGMAISFVVAVYFQFVHRALELEVQDRKSTRLNSSHTVISYAVFCLKKKNSSTT